MAVYVAIGQPQNGPEIRRYFTTQQAALRGAKRMVARYRGEAQVAWCKQGTSDPKVYLAHVGADGVTLSDFWDVGTDR